MCSCALVGNSNCIDELVYYCHSDSGTFKVAPLISV